MVDDFGKCFAFIHCRSTRSFIHSCPLCSSETRSQKVRAWWLASLSGPIDRTISEENSLSPGVTYLDWKRSSGWLESQEGRFFSDVSTNLCGSRGSLSQLKIQKPWWTIWRSLCTHNVTHPLGPLQLLPYFNIHFSQFSFFTILWKSLLQFVDYHLQSLVKTNKDATRFLTKLKQLGHLTDDALLVTLDVSSLYTNIPHNEGVGACLHFRII